MINKTLMLVFGVGLMLSLNANAYQEINRGISGSWYNPDQSGHGLAIEVAANDQFVAYWYTYNFWGTPIWLVGSGSRSGNAAIVDFYYVEGMIFGEFDPETTNAMYWGEGYFEFYSCSEGFFAWDSVLSYESGEAFGQGEIPINRLASIEGVDCNPPPTGGSSQTHLVSKIVAEFDGWDGDTIIELDNGQVWQQADFQFEYDYHYRPRVVIFEDFVFGGFRAHVEGTEKWIKVVRL